MKNLIWLLALVCVMCGCSTHNGSQQYKVSGSVATQDLNNKWVFLKPLVQNCEIVVDSAEIVDGRFEMQGKVPLEPAMVMLSISDKCGKDSAGTVGVNMVLESGNIIVDIDENLAVNVSGTPQNDMLQVCKSSIDSYYDSCALIKTMSCSADEKRGLMKHAQIVRNSTMIDAMMPHINSEAVYAVIKEKYVLFSYDELEMMYSKLNMERSVDAKMFMTQANTMTVGRKMEKLFACDVNGDSIPLMKIIGSHDYTLIDFWASWCVPCMRAMPDIQKRYDKYKGDRFEVIGMSLDSEYEKWVKAVQRIGVEWLNVSNLAGWNCPVAQSLSITYVPATVLFDKEGRVVCRNPNLDELDIYLGID